MLVRNDASSICGSDMHAWENPPPASVEIAVELPVVPGHEMMGRVADPGTVKTDSLGRPLRLHILGVGITKACAEEACLSEGATIEVKLSGPKLVLTPAQPVYELERLPGMHRYVYHHNAQLARSGRSFGACVSRTRCRL